MSMNEVLESIKEQQELELNYTCVFWGNSLFCLKDDHCVLMQYATVRAVRSTGFMEYPEQIEMLKKVRDAVGNENYTKFYWLAKSVVRVWGS